MYRFYIDNRVIGYAVMPNYIKKMSNGCYGLCSKDEAQGVSVSGTPYALKDFDNLPVVEISEISDSEFFSNMMIYEEALTELGVLPLEEDEYES